MPVSCPILTQVPKAVALGVFLPAFYLTQSTSFLLMIHKTELGVKGPLLPIWSFLSKIWPWIFDRLIRNTMSENTSICHWFLAGSILYPMISANKKILQRDPLHCCSCSCVTAVLPHTPTQSHLQRVRSLSRHGCWLIPLWLHLSRHLIISADSLIIRTVAK